MDGSSGHACLLAFDTDDPQFARGFEAGRIWAVLQAHPAEAVHEYVHASNVEMVMRLAEATGRRVEATELDGDWLEATFSAAECPTP